MAVKWGFNLFTAIAVAYLILMSLLLLFTIYLIYAVTIGVFSVESFAISSVIASMFLPSTSFLSLLQELVIFSSILFGFYAVVLAFIMPTILDVLKQHISSKRSVFTRIYAIFISTIMILLLIEPIFLLLISVSSLLIATGYQGILTQTTNGSSFNSTSILNVPNVTVKDKIIHNTYNKTLSVTRAAIADSFTSGLLILLQITIYVFIRIGVVDAYLNWGRSLERRNTQSKKEGNETQE